MIDSMQKTQIRAASEKDLPLLLKWGKQLHEVEKQYLPRLKYSETEASDRYHKQISDSHFLFLIAEMDDEPVGYLYAHIDIVDYLNTTSPQVEIEVIFLETKARGKGLAEKLIKQAISWAEKKGAFEVKAGIFAQNESSRKVFEKSGFSLVHTTYSISI